MVYIRRSDNALCSWIGMSEEEIFTMLAAQGLTGTVLSEVEYIAALEILQS